MSLALEFFLKLRSSIIATPTPELKNFIQAALTGGLRTTFPELYAGGRRPTVADLYGTTVRLRIPWGELEKSFHAIQKPDGSISLVCEGFFPRLNDV